MTLRLVGAIAGSIAAYHCAVGASIILFGITTEHPLTLRQQVEFALMWPVTVSATVWMQDRYLGVMENIKETLDEINGGRWEKKP